MTAMDVRVAIRGALDGMRESGPEELLLIVNAKLRKSGMVIDESVLVNALVDEDTNAPSRKDIHMALARWDRQSEGAWIAGTSSATPERRARVYDLLDFSEASREEVDQNFPIVGQRDIVIAKPGPWDPWYTEERRKNHGFYWNAYRGVLEKKNWDPDAIAALDESTSNIVGRLADPSGSKTYQSKGLVVGYVQSGKTANFTGIVAKAVDAGYRLIIVLTGTIEMLRGQTQRRLDMELVGEENILRGKDRNDPDAIRDVDYIGADDEDWHKQKFLRHGVSIVDTSGVPSVRRLTTMNGDYKLLKAGLDTLDFRAAGELNDRSKPLYDPVNLFESDVRLAVVKKNKDVLKKLLRDLQDVHADLGEIPVLIIDDEADQASVNTRNPRSKKSREESERTAINGLIAELLKKLTRAQYVGYTATPFANVFVSPDDSEDIFPKDFIISLKPSDDYMGGSEFHDLSEIDPDEPRTPSNSKEAAHVRDLKADSDDAERLEIRQALDAFVLSGAIKLWRAAHDETLNFRHHTMLVHETVNQSDHAELKKLIESVWSATGYSSPTGLSRLKELFEADFVLVHSAKDWGTRMPRKFEDLHHFIGTAIDKVTVAGSPVVVVNGSKESDYNAMDFQTGDYWRVMVGGTKLSRGFTVEGLTISYYRRRAMAADTLMQMGRWFGYRPGYRDLVRLFIAREVQDARGRIYDLYDAFTAIIQDEEAFRAQLQKFSELDDLGHPRVLPRQIPPLVFQQLPWLKPTGANKMYNAELDFEGDGGILKDFPRQADRGNGRSNRDQFRAVRPWTDQLGPLTTFNYVDGTPPRTKQFEARYTIVPAEEMLSALEKFKWTDGYEFNPTLRFVKQAMESGELVDWAVVVPYLKDVKEFNVEGATVPILTRKRRQGRGGFSGSSFRQRAAIERIAGNTRSPGGPAAEALNTPTRGAMLLTFAADPASLDPADRKPESLSTPIKAEDVASLFSFAVPYLSAPRGNIGFRVRDKSREDAPIIAI